MSGLSLSLLKMLFLQHFSKDLMIILADDGESGLQEFTAGSNMLWSQSSEWQSLAVAALEGDENHGSWQHWWERRQEGEWQWRQQEHQLGPYNCRPCSRKRKKKAVGVCFLLRPLRYVTAKCEQRCA